MDTRRHTLLSLSHSHSATASPLRPLRTVSLPPHRGGSPLLSVLPPDGQDNGSEGLIVQRSTCSMTTAPEGAVCCVLCSASPVPGVVRESWGKYSFPSLRRLPWCTCVSASARQSRAQCRAREFCGKLLHDESDRAGVVRRQAQFQISVNSFLAMRRLVLASLSPAAAAIAATGSRRVAATYHGRRRARCQRSLARG